jgi:hypothetical protein
MVFVKGRSGNLGGRPKGPEKVKGPPKKRGRPKGSLGPPHIVTPSTKHTVKFLYAGGYTREKIAMVLDITTQTLRAHYHEELDKAKAGIDAAMTQSVVLQGLGGPEQDWRQAVPSMAAFYAKTRMGWRENDRLQIGGAVGVFDLAALKEELKGKSDAELEELERLLGGPGADQRNDS